MSFNWLHISDVHLSDAAPYNQNRIVTCFSESLDQLISRCGSPDAIFFTGDLGSRGKPTDYASASNLFDSILKKCNLDKSRLFVVPGNHDADRADVKQFSRAFATMEEIDGVFNGSEVHAISKRFSSFAEWYDNYFSSIRSFCSNSTIIDDNVINVGGISVRICSINSAAFSFDDHDHGKLIVGLRCLELRETRSEGEADLKICLMHHPLDWLSHVEQPQVKNKIRKSFDVVLSGHLHNTDVENISGIQNNCLHVSAGALYQSPKWPITASFCQFSDGGVKVHPIRYSSTPMPRWTIDTSVFPDEPDFGKKFSLALVRAADSNSEMDDAQLPVASPSNLPVGREDEAWKSQLFASPGGKPLYAEPRISAQSQVARRVDRGEASFVSIAALCQMDDSIVIEARPEFGSTTLACRITADLRSMGRAAIFRDARKIKNYQSWLKSDFENELPSAGAECTLVLDNFDADRDAKLLRELKGIGTISRVILISVNRGVAPSVDSNESGGTFDLVRYHLWALGRSEIRTICSDMFESVSDGEFVTSLVDKIYGDLLSLRIPLSPANVVMYLKVVHREGSFNPISKVDIVSRFLLESLRRPSDSFTGSFNYNDRLDTISAFSGRLFSEGRSFFTSADWHKFCTEYADEGLFDFDADDLLNNAIESKIFVRIGDEIFFRYRFYFVYFLGRCISMSDEVIRPFMIEKHYLNITDVVDIISTLAPSNKHVISTVSDHLADRIKEFEREIVNSSFDPLLGAEWGKVSDEEEKVWKPIAKAIETGPEQAGKIDKLKNSYFSEARTHDQAVTFEKFRELEYTLFATTRALIYALKNSGDVGAREKLTAYENLLRAELAAFQVGTIFAPDLAANHIFRWGGILFIDFNAAVGDFAPQSAEAIARVVIALSESIVIKSAEDVGVQKLSRVFRARAQNCEGFDFLDVLNFGHIVGAKGKDWEKTARIVIDRCPSGSYYLWLLSNILIRDFKHNVSLISDREHTKRLIAVIQAKRGFGTKRPKPAEIDRAMKSLQKRSFFDRLLKSSTSTVDDDPAE